MTDARDETTEDGGEPFAIDVADLEVTYADGTRAVRGVDMTIPQGEFFGFLGPNGAGKTTTIKVFATLLSPGLEFRCPMTRTEDAYGFQGYHPRGR